MEYSSFDSYFLENMPIEFKEHSSFMGFNERSVGEDDSDYFKFQSKIEGNLSFY